MERTLSDGLFDKGERGSREKTRHTPRAGHVAPMTCIARLCAPLLSYPLLCSRRPLLHALIRACPSRRRNQKPPSLCCQYCTLLAQRAWTAPVNPRGTARHPSRRPTTTNLSGRTPRVTCGTVGRVTPRASPAGDGRPLSPPLPWSRAASHMGITPSPPLPFPAGWRTSAAFQRPAETHNASTVQTWRETDGRARDEETEGRLCPGRPLVKALKHPEMNDSCGRYRTISTSQKILVPSDSQLASTSTILN